MNDNSTDWSDDDLDIYVAACLDELETDPLVMQKPLMNESNFNSRGPQTINWQTDKAGVKHPVAGGLFQAIGATLVDLGWTQGVVAFAALPNADQIPYLVKYYRGFKGRMKTPVHVYMATFCPKWFASASNPGFIICASSGASSGGLPLAKSQEWYRENRGLDVNNDGIIDPHDLSAKIDQSNRSPRALELAQRIREAVSRKGTPGPRSSAPPPPPKAA